jgi:anti-sigma regulatory factor (Ser/Thr protein kinase)
MEPTTSTEQAQTQQVVAPQAVAAEPVKSLEELPTGIQITIPTHAYFLSGIRDFVLNLTKNLTGFSEQWAFRFQAVVDELCNNAIEHGSQAGQMIYLSLISIKGESLEVVVEDTGTGQQKMNAEQMKKLLADRKQMMSKEQYMGFRGRGLPKIVGEWTDEISFEDSEKGGLRVRVKKYLRKEEDAVFSHQKDDPTHLVLT